MCCEQWYKMYLKRRSLGNLSWQRWECVCCCRLFQRLRVSVISQHMGIHSKVRNMVKQETTEKLVYVYTNRASGATVAQ